MRKEKAEAIQAYHDRREAFERQRRYQAELEKQSMKLMRLRDQLEHVLNMREAAIERGWSQQVDWLSNDVNRLVDEMDDLMVHDDE